MTSGKHPHYPQRKIVDYLKSIDQKWSSLVERGDYLLNEARIFPDRRLLLGQYLTQQTKSVPEERKGSDNIGQKY